MVPKEAGKPTAIYRRLCDLEPSWAHLQLGYLCVHMCAEYLRPAPPLHYMTIARIVFMAVLMLLYSFMGCLCFQKNEESDQFVYAARYCLHQMSITGVMMTMKVFLDAPRQGTQTLHSLSLSLSF